MALPKTTQDRIERDAIEYMHSEIKGMVGDTDELQPSSLKYAHIAGATAENERAQGLVDALHDIASGKSFPKWIAQEALQQWKDGKEVENEKEPLIPIAVYKQQGCNVSNSRPCPHCGNELSRDRNLCCCGKEVENGIH